MELSRNNIAAVVVWFNPGQEEVDAISLYHNDVSRVVVVDNSASSNADLLNGLQNAEYIPLFENKGIATALNTGCRKALEYGAEWFLTMDQDSRWDIHSFHDFLGEVAEYGQCDNVGIFTPYHDCDGHPETHHRNGRFEERRMVMCSGNLLRAEAWLKANGFRDDFFIDSVDDEMCCHLWKLGYKVVRANGIFLNHQLGEGIKYLPFTHHQYIPHKAWRYYYIGRNIHRMMRLYPDTRKYYRREMRKYVKRLLLYDWDDKVAKLKNLKKGWYEEK